ncbi:hypothetical protein ACPYIV_16135 [Parabacteroides sp. ASD2025]|jgi:hypothetical protein|nr:hypothetical protein [uncultured Parabacteroides sp.]
MGLVMKKSRYPFFEGKTSFFPFICRFITMKTVVIAMTRDFIATKTVVVTYEVNVHGNEDGRHFKILRSSRRKDVKILFP